MERCSTCLWDNKGKHGSGWLHSLGLPRMGTLSWKVLREWLSYWQVHTGPAPFHLPSPQGHSYKQMAVNRAVHRAVSMRAAKGGLVSIHQLLPSGSTIMQKIGLMTLGASVKLQASKVKETPMDNTSTRVPLRNSYNTSKHKAQLTPSPSCPCTLSKYSIPHCWKTSPCCVQGVLWVVSQWYSSVLLFIVLRALSVTDYPPRGVRLGGAWGEGGWGYEWAHHDVELSYFDRHK